MSEDNKFFRFVWRFNGILVMLLLIGGLACIGWRAVSHHGFTHWEHGGFMHGMNDRHAAQAYSIRPLEFGLMPGRTERLYALDRYSKGDARQLIGPVVVAADSTTVNILAVDEKAKTSRWLFSHGERQILSETMLTVYDAKPAGKDSPDIAPTADAVGFVFLVVEPDTNKDGHVSAKDSQVLYFYRLDGKAPAKILEADRIMPMVSDIGTSEYKLFYQKGNQSFAAIYALPKFELTSQVQIAGLPALGGKPDGLTKIGFTGLDQYLDH